MPTLPARPLRDVHSTPSVNAYIAQLWARRPYIWYVASSELRSRQAATRLGNFWHVLTPILQIAVYFVIFGLLLQIDRGIDNFILFLTVGLFFFQSTQRATLAGAKSIVANTGIIKAIKFPRAILPLSSTLTETLASLSAFLIVFAVALLTGQPPRWEWLVLMPLIALLTLFNTGAALVAARSAIHFRDISQLLPFVFRLLMWGSGVIFSLEAFTRGKEWVQSLFALNPLYGFITLARWAVMGDDNAEPVLVVSVVIWTVALLVGGFLWVRRGEERYARD